MSSELFKEEDSACIQFFDQYIQQYMETLTQLKTLADQAVAEGDRGAADMIIRKASELVHDVAWLKSCAFINAARCIYNYQRGKGEDSLWYTGIN